MKQLFNSILSFLIISSLVLGDVSLESFHDHEDHVQHCEQDHKDEAPDACHFQIFHEGGLAQCTDHQHLIQGHEDCKLCNLDIPQVQKNKAAFAHVPFFDDGNDLEVCNSIERAWNTLKDQIPNKGPPNFA